MAAAEPGKAALSFSDADRAVIARNVELKALMRVDPAGVRTLLDAIAAAGQPPERPSQRYRDVLGGRSGGQPGGQGHKGGEPGSELDPAQNPDLSILFQRSSPEAAYDLFQIIKRAGRQSVAN
jgi:hypothetical protein